MIPWNEAGSILLAPTAAAPFAFNGDVKRFMQALEIIHVQLEFDGGQIIGSGVPLFVETQHKGER